MSLVRGNALGLPLADESVDLVVTSPPYFALRSYTDGGEHYDGQIGSEAGPAAFIANLVSATRECVRVLKPSGSIWVNLGDKYAGSGGHNNANLSRHRVADDGHRTVGGASRRQAPDRYNQNSDGIRAKSLMGLPWRYALGCIDDLGLILRAEVIWSKPNGLPESVTDRVRRSHEQWFHFTKEPRYYSAIDEIREGYAPGSLDRIAAGFATNTRAETGNHNNGMMRSMAEGQTTYTPNALGKLPGSVWTVPTEPLRVPDHLPQHFAAFPSEWPRRIILGWSPSGICVRCGEGRRPVVERASTPMTRESSSSGTAARSKSLGGGRNVSAYDVDIRTSIVGESCACTLGDGGGSEWSGGNSRSDVGAAPTSVAPPTRPAVVLDPFAGTGTTVAVANALGRHGIGVDLSADYLTVARWRCADPKLRAKVLGVEPPPPVVPGQGDLFSLAEPDDFDLEVAR